mgnify:CR=1 FL=1
MEENKYAESDKKCCEWLDKALNEKNITLEKQELLLRLKKFMKESISEDLKLIRGKYLVFIKDKLCRLLKYIQQFLNSKNYLSL